MSPYVRIEEWRTGSAECRVVNPTVAASALLVMAAPWVWRPAQDAPYGPNVSSVVPGTGNDAETLTGAPA